MKISIKELKQLIKCALISEKYAPMDKREIFTNIIYVPETNQYFDRWEKVLPSAPGKKDSEVFDWLESNGVDTIAVKGKKLTVKSFMKFLQLMRSKQVAPPPEEKMPEKRKWQEFID